MSYNIINKGKVHHYHIKPGWISRLLRGLKKDAIIQCDCGAYLQWSSNYSGYDWDVMDWHTREEHGLNKKEGS